MLKLKTEATAEFYRHQSKSERRLSLSFFLTKEGGNFKMDYAFQERQVASRKPRLGQRQGMVAGKVKR